MGSPHAPNRYRITATIRAGQYGGVGVSIGLLRSRFQAEYREFSLVASLEVILEGPASRYSSVPTPNEPAADFRVRERRRDADGSIPRRVDRSRCRSCH